MPILSRLCCYSTLTLARLAKLPWGSPSSRAVALEIFLELEVCLFRCFVQIGQEIDIFVQTLLAEIFRNGHTDIPHSAVWAGITLWPLQDFCTNAAPDTAKWHTARKSHATGRFHNSKLPYTNNKNEPKAQRLTFQMRRDGSQTYWNI